MSICIYMCTHIYKYVCVCTYIYTHMCIYVYVYRYIHDFPGGSDGKESTCNTGDLGLTSGLGRSLEKGMATHSSILAGKFHGQRSLAGCSPWSLRELGTTEWLSLSVLCGKGDLSSTYSCLKRDSLPTGFLSLLESQDFSCSSNSTVEVDLHYSPVVS